MHPRVMLQKNKLIYSYELLKWPPGTESQDQFERFVRFGPLTPSPGVISDILSIVDR